MRDTMRMLMMSVSYALAPLRRPKRSANKSGLKRRKKTAIAAIQKNITANADQNRAAPMTTSP